MSTISERLRRAIDRQPPEGRRRGVGLLLHKLEGRDVAGATYPSMKTYLDGDVVPPLPFLEAAADALGVRRAWLAFNEGAMTEAEERERRVAEAAALERAILDEEVPFLSGTLVQATFVEAMLRLAPPDEVFSESVARNIAELVLAPLKTFGLKYRPRGPEFIDYAHAMLHALMLLPEVGRAAAEAEAHGDTEVATPDQED